MTTATEVQGLVSCKPCKWQAAVMFTTVNSHWEVEPDRMLEYRTVQDNGQERQQLVHVPCGNAISVAKGPKTANVRPVPLMPAQTAREKVTEWVRQYVAARDIVPLPELVRAACNHFQSDNAVVASAYRAMMYAWVHKIGRDVLHDSRRRPEVGAEDEQLDDIDAEDIGDDEDEPTTATDPLWRKSRWAKWLERGPDFHERLFNMTRGDLLFAAMKRRRTASIHNTRAAMMEILAKRLEGDERVRDRFTPEEIDAIWERLTSTDKEGAA